jgi:hypothetical protein
MAQTSQNSCQKNGISTFEFWVLLNKGTKTVTGIAVAVVRLMSVVDAGRLEV